MLIEKNSQDNASRYTSSVVSAGHGAVSALPLYYDWSDHIAQAQATDYRYHLNKIVTDIIAIVKRYKKHIPGEFFEGWNTNWYAALICAGWLHDIGMLASEDGTEHGYESAAYILAEPAPFDFSPMTVEQKVKIAALCIKHNTTWSNCHKKMQQLTAKTEQAHAILKTLFLPGSTPVWELDFCGRILSLCDSLRYRGPDLRNNQAKPFEIWYKCPEKHCDRMYTEPKEHCTKPGCLGKPAPTPVTPCSINTTGIDPADFEALLDREKPVLYSRDTDRVSLIEKKIAERQIYITTRPLNKLYTLGDMALYHVELISFDDWLTDLRKQNVNTELLKKYETNLFFQVLLIHLNPELSDAALFSLHKYLTAHLAANIGSDTDYPFRFSNHLFMQLSITGEQSFTQWFNQFRTAAPESPEEQYSQALTVTFQDWQVRQHLVVPVEIIADSLRSIEL